MLGSRELRSEIVKEYLNMLSTASISRWLKASLMQNSEELTPDEAPEPFILTLHNCEGTSKNGCNMVRRITARI